NDLIAPLIQAQKAPQGGAGRTENLDLQIRQTGSFVVPAAATGLADRDARIRRICLDTILQTATGVSALVIIPTGVSTVDRPEARLFPLTGREPTADEIKAMQRHADDTNARINDMGTIALALR